MKVEFTDENKSNKEFVVCELNWSDEKDTFVLGVLQNNDIDGVLKFSSLTLDEKCILSYDITGKITLSEFLKAVMGKDQVLNLLISTLNLLNELYEFDIDSNFLVLDFERVYVDVAKMSLRFICLPVEVNNGNNNDVIKFLKEILLVANFSNEKNLKYVSEILLLLNHQKQISPITLLNKIVEMKSDVTTDEEAVTEREEKDKVIDYGEETKGKSQDELVMESSLPAEKKNMNVRKMINKSPKIKLLTENSDQSLGQTLVNFFLGKSTPKTVEETSKVSPVRKIKQPVSQKRTRVKKPKVKGVALVRESTEEKISLRNTISKTYKIGSEIGADYVVSDNAAVSRSHAILVNEEDGYYIVDNETINGTFVNDNKVEFRYGPLKHKDKITLANEMFEFLEK